MTKCVSLGEFRQRKAERQRHATPRSAMLTMADVAGRDYSSLEDGVYAVLRLRDLLEAHVGPDPRWQALVLALLAELHARSDGRGRPGRLERATRADRLDAACEDLKAFVEDCLDEDNQRGLGGAVVLLNLLRKSQPLHGNA